MNPCPCGYYGHPTRKCSCSAKKVVDYQQRISGPLLDRFDLHIEVAPAEFKDLSSDKKEESSEAIRKRVSAARNIQSERFKGTGITCNALITDSKLQQFCPMDDEASSALDRLFRALSLSGRAYSRILKTSRTIADLDRSELIRKNHITEAAQYRIDEEQK
jgi:magnesium chelatase family protein